MSMRTRERNLHNPRIPQRRDPSGDEVLEDDMTRRTNEKMDQLSRSVSQIKEGANAIKQYMVDEEGLVQDVDKGIDKN